MRSNILQTGAGVQMQPCNAFLQVAVIFTLIGEIETRHAHFRGWIAYAERLSTEVRNLGAKSRSDLLDFVSGIEQRWQCKNPRNRRSVVRPGRAMALSERRPQAFMIAELVLHGAKVPKGGTVVRIDV